MFPLAVRNAIKHAPHGRTEDALRGKFGRSFANMPDPATATGAALLTPAQLAAGLLLGTPGAAANYQLPTVADLLTELGEDFEVGEAFEFNVANRATTDTFDITITTNTGWTLDGSMVVEAREATQAQPSTGRFWARRSGDAAFTLYRVG
jgi:hypothetical protein